MFCLCGGPVTVHYTFISNGAADPIHVVKNRLWPSFDPARLVFNKICTRLLFPIFQHNSLIELNGQRFCLTEAYNLQRDNFGQFYDNIEINLTTKS